MIGYIAVILLTCASIPQLYKLIVTKDARGLSLTMLVCWLLGMLLMILDMYLLGEGTIALYLNYILNSGFALGMIIAYFNADYK